MGIDCGATNLRIGIFDEKGNLLQKKQVSSPLKTKSDQFAQIIKKQLASPSQTWEIKAMGVGVPGPLDLEKGLILPSANLGNYEPIDLKKQFGAEFNVPIFFDRDTNLALLGEVWQGGAVGAKEVVMLTLGSGVGGAIMTGGEIDRGSSGRAGEIGHMIIQMQNPPKCGLGHQGCLEAWINSAKDLDQLGTYLGYGLANIVDIFNPQKILIGGGKLNLGDFLPKAIAVMIEKGMKPAVDEVEVVYAKLGEWSGVYGAARLAMK